VVGTTTATGTALILGFGAVSVLQNNLTLGELVVLLGYIAQIYNPLTQISTTFAQLQQQFINLESSLSILDTAPEVIEAPDAVATERAQGRVAYRDINFTYPEIKYKVEEKRSFRPPDEADETASVIPETAPRRLREVLEAPEMVTLYERARDLGLGVEELMAATREPALRDVSFEVLPGQHVAVVGPTGAGKTTLLNLLMRFYDPTEGAVLLDGVDLRRLKIASLRDQISVVPQEPLLFGGTIADNIRYGRLGASDEEVEQAAKAANVHQFIARLPNDYETLIGERGSQLSGGERQRISVARAFLKDSPIAILDEPTSSVDSQTEAVILAALDRLMEGRTTFTIAHRLSTVRRADLILVFNEGLLVQRGTHQELLAEGGLYKRLHDIQAGLAEADLSWVGRRRELGPSGILLLYADLLVAAIYSLLRDGSADDLVTLVEAYPDRITHGPTWSLIGGILAVLQDDSEAPLRDLARRAGERSRIVQAFAFAARYLLDSREALRAISDDLRQSGSLSGVDPLDADLIAREPWTQLAKVSPEAADLLMARVPTGDGGRTPRSRSRGAFARGSGVRRA
jgi:ABC-type transport system involved in Fe-S cluster assembly fused permease/ATPase subunit